MHVGFQEAIFDKSTGKVVLKTFSLYKKLLTLFRAGHDQGESWGAWGHGTQWATEAAHLGVWVTHGA